MAKPTARLRVVRCEDCRLAVVGRGEVCRCLAGWWSGLSLPSVEALIGPCEDFEPAGDEVAEAEGVGAEA